MSLASQLHTDGVRNVTSQFSAKRSLLEYVEENWHVVDIGIEVDWVLRRLAAAAGISKTISVCGPHVRVWVL